MKAKPAAKEPEIKIVDNPDKELEALRSVVLTFESLQSETRGRMLRFLRDKYHADWPSDSY